MQAGKKNRNDQWKYLKCVYGYIACCHSQYNKNLMWFLQKCVTAFRILCISHVSIIPLRRSLYTKPCFIGKTDAHFPLLIILLAKRNICIKEMQKCAIRQYRVHSMNNLNHKKFVSRSILFVFNANLCSSFILLSSLILYSLIKLEVTLPLFYVTKP